MKVIDIIKNYQEVKDCKVLTLFNENFSRTVFMSHTSQLAPFFQCEATWFEFLGGNLYIEFA